MTTSYVISLDKKSGSFQKVIKLPRTLEPDEIEAYFERMCRKNPQNKFVLVVKIKKVCCGCYVRSMTIYKFGY